MSLNENVDGIEKIELMFDTLLIQTFKRGITYEEFAKIDANEEFYGEFEQLSSWQRQFGFKFNIYNDHLIDGKKHFHLDNQAKGIHLKLDFSGNILEDKGKNRIDKKAHRVLMKFLMQPSVIKEANKLWNKNNSVD
jgi:hypothetical protein